MREILFRGKRLDNGKWFEGDLIHGVNCLGRDQRGRCFIWSQSADAHGIIEEQEVDPSTVSQYTGHKDMKRKKIFEGDIVQRYKTEFNPARKYRDPYKVHIMSDFPPAVEEFYSPFDSFTEGVGYEVIGNIHDNPELLSRMPQKEEEE